MCQLLCSNSWALITNFVLSILVVSKRMKNELLNHLRGRKQSFSLCEPYNQSSWHVPLTYHSWIPFTFPFPTLLSRKVLYHCDVSSLQCSLSCGWSDFLFQDLYRHAWNLKPLNMHSNVLTMYTFIKICKCINLYIIEHFNIFQRQHSLYRTSCVYYHALSVYIVFHDLMYCF